MDSELLKFVKEKPDSEEILENQAKSSKSLLQRHLYSKQERLLKTQ